MLRDGSLDSEGGDRVTPKGRLAAWSAVIAVASAAYFLVFVVAIPEIAGAPDGILWTTAHSVLGVGLVALAIALYRSGPTEGRLTVGTVLLVAVGIFAGLVGIVPGFFGDSRADVLILVNFVALLFVLPASFILVSLSMKVDDAWRPVRGPALAIAVAVPVSFVAVVLSPVEWEAALGRVTDLLLVLWVLLVAVRLWSVAGRLQQAERKGD
jgi:hypothetical protein